MSLFFLLKHLLNRSGGDQVKVFCGSESKSAAGGEKKKPTLGPFYLVNMSRDAICSNMSRPFALGVCEFDTSVDCVSAVTSNPLSGI